MFEQGSVQLAPGEINVKYKDEKDRIQTLRSQAENMSKDLEMLNRYLNEISKKQE